MTPLFPWQISVLVVGMSGVNDNNYLALWELTTSISFYWNSYFLHCCKTPLWLLLTSSSRLQSVNYVQSTCFVYVQSPHLTCISFFPFFIILCFSMLFFTLLPIHLGGGTCSVVYIRTSSAVFLVTGKAQKASFFFPFAFSQFVNK